jgi:hypothetical protein
MHDQSQPAPIEFQQSSSTRLYTLSAAAMLLQCEELSLLFDKGRQHNDWAIQQSIKVASGESTNIKVAPAGESTSVNVNQARGVAEAQETINKSETRAAHQAAVADECFGLVPQVGTA